MAIDEHAPLFVISVAAELAGMHPQTLRTYDRLGLVSPSRTRGRGRRYSAWDITQLREIQRLSQEDGVNLAGIKRILELENEAKMLRAQLAEATDRLDSYSGSADPRRRIFAADREGRTTALRRGQRPSRRESASAVVVWRPNSRY